MPMYRWVMGLSLATALLTPSASRAGLIVYGVDNLSNIVMVDMDTNQVTKVATGLSGGAANGLAFDDDNNRLIFRNTTRRSDFYAFDLSTHTLSSLGGSSIADDVSDAGFYNGAYWYIATGTDDLIKLNFGPGGPVRTVYSGNFDDPVTGLGYNFGDIAITVDGMLYASSSRGFFRVDISGSSPAGFVNLGGPLSPMLQIALNETGTGLIGTDHNTGKWYDVAFDGTRTLRNGPKGADLVKLRDIATRSVPEPGSVVLMGLGSAGLTGFALRRRRRAAA